MYSNRTDKYLNITHNFSYEIMFLNMLELWAMPLRIHETGLEIKWVKGYNILQSSINWAHISRTFSFHDQ